MSVSVHYDNYNDNDPNVSKEIHGSLYTQSTCLANGAHLQSQPSATQKNLHKIFLEPEGNVSQK